MSFLADLIGGAQGGITGSYASHPFDVCSMAVVRGEAANGFAAGAKRVRAEGVFGLWRGAWLNATFNAVNKSIYFVLYAWMTALYLRRTQRDSVANAANLLIGYLSQLGSVPFNMPLYVIFNRSLQPESAGLGAAAIVRALYKEGGYARFYQGWSSWLGYALRPAIEMTVYDQIRARIVPPGMQLGGVRAFLLGALGRMIGTAIVFPVNFAMKTCSTGMFGSFWEAWSVTVKSKGVLALWKGLGPELPRGIAMNATMMATREVLAPFNQRVFG